MVPTVTFYDAAAIAARRTELLERVHMPLDVLRQKGALYQLDPEEQSVLRALEELDFLESDE